MNLQGCSHYGRPKHLFYTHGGRSVVFVEINKGIKDLKMGLVVRVKRHPGFRGGVHVSLSRHLQVLQFPWQPLGGTDSSKQIQRAENKLGFHHSQFLHVHSALRVFASFLSEAKYFSPFTMDNLLRNRGAYQNFEIKRI